MFIYNESPPNIYYEKFFKSFSEINSLKVSDWKVKHLIGYFCKRYQEFYKKDFKFKLNSSTPSKCFETFQINKLKYLLTSDSEILKQYIDWVFDNIIISKKKRITSISILTQEQNVNVYKFKFLFNENNSYSRNMELPLNHKMMFENIFNRPILTYGDLAFLYKMKEQDDNLNQLFNQVTNFDFSILDKII